MIIFKKILKWAGIAFALAFFALVIYRAFVLRSKENAYSARIQLSDVLGKNLPSAPSNPDATIAGVDANKNGIRDDVELAIFKEYPNSAKTRAVLLQYALALQMQMTQRIKSTDAIGAVVNQEDTAIFCMAKIVPMKGESGVMMALEKYASPLQEKQFNTEERRQARKDIYSRVKTGRDQDSSCDIDLASLKD